MLNTLSKSIQPKTNQTLQDIWGTATKGTAEQAFDLSSGPHLLDSYFQMLSGIFCGIFSPTERSRRWHRVALAAVKGERTLAEFVEHVDVPPNQIQDGKKQLVTMAENVFGAGMREAATQEHGQQTLHAKIGQLMREEDFLAHALGPR